MSRREFGRLTAAVAVGTWLPVRNQAPLSVDANRLLDSLDRLATFGRTPQGGISRVAFSDADLAARAFVRDLMVEAGLTVRVDEAGNLLGDRPGSESGLPPLMVGSHIDSVPDGGNFDGQVGSMAAVEVARTLHEAGVRTRHPLQIAIFPNEEGGKTGSRALSGEVRDFELDIVTASGLTIGDGLRRLGGDPTALDAVRRQRGDVAVFFELHVEQGAVLDSGDIDIGVVEGIVGIKRWNVTFEGFANHAGTTPMDARQDALLAAARFIDAANRTVRAVPGRHVATVGRIAAEPGAPNVIPGRVILSLEIRDLAMARIDALFDMVADAGRQIAGNTATRIAFDEFYVSRAAPTDERLRDLVERAAGNRGLTALRIPSGAGHDAQSIAQFAPVGMIFVPSVDGISHSPRERSRPDAIVAGTNVLLDCLRAADRLDWG